MIFKKLVENLPKIPKNATIKFNQGDNKVRKEIISRVLAAYNNPELLNNKYIFKTTYDSAMHYGLDTSINPWLQFLDQQNLDFDKHLSEQLPTLWQLHLKENIDLLQEFVLNDLNKIDFNKTTSAEEFNYTVKLLDVLNNQDKLSKFFNDPSVVDVAQLHQNNDVNDYYKRAGIGKHNDPDTLFGMVEIWSEGNEVEKTVEEYTEAELKKIIERDERGRIPLKELEQKFKSNGQLVDDFVCYSNNTEHKSYGSPQEIQDNIDSSSKIGQFYIWDAQTNKWSIYTTKRTKKVLRSL